jgi:predicted AlkP superfamily phosphohydrolase/phosphomutase
VAITISSADVSAATERFTQMVTQLDAATGKTKQAIRVRTLKAEHDLRDMCMVLGDQLGTQFEWLYENPAHPKATEFENRWMADLKIYVAANDAIHARYDRKEIAA